MRVAHLSGKVRNLHRILVKTFRTQAWAETIGRYAGAAEL